MKLTFQKANKHLKNTYQSHLFPKLSIKALLIVIKAYFYDIFWMKFS